jgi:hypothetical protein
MESKRYNDLHSLYDQVNQSATHYKQSLKQSKEREERDKALILELNSVILFILYKETVIEFCNKLISTLKLIKEQKKHLQDLVKSRFELSDTIKKQDSKIIELANSELKTNDLSGNLKKEKSELAVRVQALECLLDGLRQEKKLWSQELAQQGLEKSKFKIIYDVQFCKCDFFLLRKRFGTRSWSFGSQN